MTSMETADWSKNKDYMSIVTAGSSAELRRSRIACQSILLEQLNLIPTQEWMYRVNLMHDRVAQTAVQICEAQMKEAGYGSPPCAYSFIVFGSAGRQEATLWSDQDNGLIIEGDSDESKTRYFEPFGNMLSDLLSEVGYEKCEGKVMCSEPLWRKTLPEWEQQLQDWRMQLAWEPIRYLLISSDMRHISGSDELSRRWRESFHAGVTSNERLSTAILRNTVRHKATLNLLGQVLTERFGDHAGGFDIKYGVYIPLVNYVRHLSLQHGIWETSTLQRLEALQLLGETRLMEGIREAFLTGLRMRVNTPYVSQDGLLASSDYVAGSVLKNKQQLSELRDSLLIVRRMHRTLQRQLRSAERRQL
ncbi:CBS domain-containing protein [Paenibacillus wynnii]|nr:CBS domain-containing protein [Paenibacillus wynnii]